METILSFTALLLSLIFVLFFILVFFLHLIVCKFSGGVSKPSEVGPPTYPIIGCLISFYKNRYRLLDWYTQLLAQSPTNTIVVRRFGARRTVVTANPKNVKYILKTNFKNYPKGKPFTEILGDFLGSGIFNVDGELWRIQRKLVSHEFCTNSLQEYVMKALQEEVHTNFLPLLESLSKDRKPVDLQDLLRRLAFNMVCKISFGIDRCSLDPSVDGSPLGTAFDKSSEICARRGAASLPVSWKIKRWLGIGSERKLRDAVAEVRAYVNKAIHYKIRKINETGFTASEDLLCRMILAGHDEKMIRDVVISFIMAGRDTTSAAMTWLFWLLTRHSVINQQLFEEVEKIIKEKSHLGYESLKELGLLQACLCESMRLYPPVAWDSKHAIEDDLLPDGTIVKVGDRVTYFPYGMGRMEAIWGTDWHEFKPERWFITETGTEGSLLKKVCPYKFPVFQAGPRECIGKEMAFLQMKYVVASVLQRFEIKPINPGQPVFVPLLTAHMAGGFQVIVSKRGLS